MMTITLLLTCRVMRMIIMTTSPTSDTAILVIIPSSREEWDPHFVVGRTNSLINLESRLLWQLRKK